MNRIINTMLLTAATMILVSIALGQASTPLDHPLMGDNLTLGPSSARPIAQRPQAPVPSEWQSNFAKFVEAIRACATSNCPVRVTFEEAEVAWGGTLVSWDPTAKVVQIDMGLQDPVIMLGATKNKLVCCTSKVREASEWQGIAPGTKVRFQAALGSLVPLMIAKGTALVFLQDAILLPPNAAMTPRPRKWVSGLVVNPNGSAVAGLSVTIGGAGFYAAPKTAEDGSFCAPVRRDAGPVGPVSLGVFSETDNSYAMATEITAADPITLTLRPGAAVNVIVKEPNGKLVKDALEFRAGRGRPCSCVSANWQSWLEGRRH